MNQIRMYGLNALVFAGVLLSASCGGGGGGGGDTPATGKLKLTPSSTQADPANYLTATVTNVDDAAVDPARVELIADVGQNMVAPLPFQVVSGNTIRFITPLGVFQSPAFDTGPGVVKLSLRPVPTAVGLTPSLTVDLTINAQNLPAAAPGDLSRAYLAATVLLIQDSIANLEFLRDNDNSLSDETINAIIQKHNTQIAQNNQIIAAIERVQAGETITVGTIQDVDITLAPESLPSLDQYTFALFKITPTATPAAAAARASSKRSLYTKRSASQPMEAAPQAIEDEFDIRGLAREIADGAREVAGRNRDIAGAVVSVIVVGALISGAPAVAAAAAGLGAVAWFTTTAAGAAIGMYLEAGTAAILDGQATTSDFTATGQFVLDSYISYAQSYLRDSALESFFGPTMGAVITAADDVRGAVSNFLTNDVMPAYQSGQIPSEGVHEPVCGDGMCESGESAQSCGADCAVCGNGICEGTENSTSCPGDCPSNVNQCCLDTNNCPSETGDSCPGDCCCCGPGQVCQTDSVCG